MEAYLLPESEGVFDRNVNNTLTNATLYKLQPLVQDMSSPIATAFQIINFSLGLPLNIYACILLIRVGGLDGSVVYGLNQCICDILFALPAPLLVLCYVNMRNLCFVKPCVFFTGTCLAARFSFQCCVCFDHYLAVVCPVLFLKYKSIRYRLAGSVSIWIYSLTFGTVCINYFLEMPYSLYGTLFIILLNIHLFFCFSILRVLRKPGPGERERTNSGVNMVKKKAFELVLFNLLIFMIQTIPIAAAFGIEYMLSSDAFSLAFLISMCIYILAGIMQPILTLHKMGKLAFILCV